MEKVISKYNQEYFNKLTETRKKELELAKRSTIFKKLMFRDWLIIPTVHAGAQTLSRRPDFTLDDWKLIHLRMMDHIIKNDIESGHYLFIQNPLNRVML